MARPVGSKNKVRGELIDMLVNLIEQSVNSIEVDKLTMNQRLKLLQLSLHYVIPKLRTDYVMKKDDADLPLWIE